jgi:hypothetical protein
MTPGKLGLIALQLHVVGDERTAPWAPEPFLTAVTVSPQGFVFKGIDNDVYVSDVRTLATSDDPFDDGDVWTLYSLDEKTGEIKPPRTQPPAVQIGGGVLPVPEKDLWRFKAGSLTRFGENAVLPLERAGNHITDELTDETRRFVYQHLGVNVSHVDWNSAHMHRLINAEYGNLAKSAHVVPFTPHRALRALRNAVNANAKKTRTNPSLPTLGPEHEKAGRYSTPSDKPTR